jgi:hypothetical protein
MKKIIIKKNEVSNFLKLVKASKYPNLLMYIGSKLNEDNPNKKEFLELMLVEAKTSKNDFYATWVIENSGNYQEIRREAVSFYKELMSVL